jgi:phenylalanyl-tRNA synthetase beta chain
MHIGGLAYGSAWDEQWGMPTRKADFFDIKGDLEELVSPLVVRFERAAHPALHPGRSAAIFAEDRRIGWAGELHPKWQQKYELPAAPVLFELDAEALMDIALPRFSPVSKFPPVVRDLAVVVPENVEVVALLDVLRGLQQPLVKDIFLFDVYRGKGMADHEKSLAFRIVMQDTDKTLTDQETDQAMASLSQSLVMRFGARLRG